MKDLYLISDTHFNHSRVLEFTTTDGKLLRPGFRNVQEMNELIIYNWNKTVRPDDIIIHLGDLVMGGFSSLASIMPRLNGKKILILGNHDYEAADYIPYFGKVCSMMKLTDFSIPLYLSHCPLNEASLYSDRVGNGLNLHGHIHDLKLDSSLYCNLCVEHTNYKPIHIEDIISRKFV